MAAAECDKQETPSTPEDLVGVRWPTSFCEAPKGANLEFSEGGTRATRSSGVGRGVAFVGPLQFNDESATYFEFQVAELEASRTQTVAVGVCTQLPAPESKLLVNTARELSCSHYLLGYDLPRLFVSGKEVAKINAKEWRPLKQLAVGDRLGLVYERDKMKISVFINGDRKVSLPLPGPSPPSSQKFWGVVDVHGTLKSVSLVQAKVQPVLADDNKMTVANPCSLQNEVSKNQLAVLSPSRAAQLRSAATQEFAQLNAATATPCRAVSWANESATVRRSSTEADVGLTAMPPPPSPRRKGSDVAPAAALASSSDATSAAGKRRRVGDLKHPCGCLVHLICHAGAADGQPADIAASNTSTDSSLIHVPCAEFIIGRNAQLCNLALDSQAVPNMVSRRHAIIEPFGSTAVMITDCSSLNGTFVNGRRISRETLRNGDVVVMGNPAQSPPELKFTVSMPTTK